MKMSCKTLALLGLLAFPACEEESSAGPGELRQVHANLKKFSAPVECSEYRELAGDPAVLKDGDVYRIFATSLDKAIKGGGISQATSPDGLNWTLASAGDEATGKALVLRGRNNTWEHQLETAFALKQHGTYFLYYCGYPTIGWPTNPGQIGVATSTDAVTFKRPFTDPILKPTPRGYDANGLYSPAVIFDNDQFVMVYAGHCYPNDKTPPHVTPGIYILGATSKDGLNWTKRPEPVLAPSDKLESMINGVAEPALVKADNQYYLFFTANLGDDETRHIAIARSNSPFGPWQIRKDPVLTSSPDTFDKKGVMAPSVLIENGTLRMWYLTSNDDKHMTGYAEIPWPLDGW